MGLDLAVVTRLLDPLLQQMTGDGVVPVLAAFEAEGVTAMTLDWLSFNINMLRTSGVKIIKKL